jgi:hypothetical protein
LYRGSLFPRFKFLQLMRESVAPGLEVIAFDDEQRVPASHAKGFIVQLRDAFALRFDLGCGLDAERHARATPML